MFEMIHLPPSGWPWVGHMQTFAAQDSGVGSFAGNLTVCLAGSTITGVAMHKWGMLRSMKRDITLTGDS